MPKASTGPSPFRGMNSKSITGTVRPIRMSKYNPRTTSAQRFIRRNLTRDLPADNSHSSTPAVRLAPRASHRENLVHPLRKIAQSFGTIAAGLFGDAPAVIADVVKRL